MRMIAMLRISMLLLVTGVMALPVARAAEEPDPISITNSNLRNGLSPADIKQVQAHVQYWISEVASAERSAGIYSARDGLLADYNKYGDSIRFKGLFARSTAALLPAAMDKLAKTDRLKAQKEVNYALAISNMPELTSIGALDAMVKHTNPAVRFLAWKGFGKVRNSVIRTGGAGVDTLFAALARHAGAEPSPLVATVIVEVLHIKKAELTTNSFKKAFDRNFKLLTAMQKISTARLAAGDASWARPCIAAIGILKDAAEFYKPDSKMTTSILQQLVDMAYAAAKAYKAAEGVGTGAFQCIPLLLQVEPVLGSMSSSKDTDIKAPLLDKKKSPAEKTSGVLRGVLEWVDRLEDLGVKMPKFPAKKAPAPATQPATTVS
jgi:hypothetical protein